VSKIRRIGLTPDPPGGWPLDHLFVGVATLRTTRELFAQGRAMRAWDLALRTGVSPQGSADALARLERLGLAWAVTDPPRGYAASFTIDHSHALVKPLSRLFSAEYALAPRPPRRFRKRESVESGRPETGGSATPA
jgi:hypothetical protein